jgi:energy-coupling factor transport system permease protein
MALVIPLLAFGIRRATRAAIAMEARGLQPARPRSQLPQPEVTKYDISASAVGLVALLVALSLG